MSSFTRIKNAITIMLLMVSCVSICKANDDLFAPIPQVNMLQLPSIDETLRRAQQANEMAARIQNEQDRQASAMAETAARIQNERIQQQLEDIERRQAEAALKLAEEKRIATQKAHELEEKRIAEEERFHNMLLAFGLVTLLLIVGFAYIVITRNQAKKEPVTSSDSKFFSDNSTSKKFNWLERLQTIIIPLRKVIGVLGCVLSSVMIVLACLSAVASIFTLSVVKPFLMIVAFVEIYLKVWVLFQLFKYSWKQFSNQSPLFSRRFNLITVPLLAGSVTGGSSSILLLLMYAFDIDFDVSQIYRGLIMALVTTVVFFVGCMLNNYFHKKLG